MKRVLNIYSYALPPLLLPLGYWLWWRLCGDHRFVAIVLSMPILFAYIVPGLGTNWLGLWEFDTRWKLGRFRPHHGFVFGSATGILTLVCVDPRWPPFSGWELARTALVVGSFLAFWNWAYDILAIRRGIARRLQPPLQPEPGARSHRHRLRPGLLRGLRGLLRRCDPRVPVCVARARLVGACLVAGDRLQPRGAGFARRRVRRSLLPADRLDRSSTLLPEGRFAMRRSSR